MIQRDYRAIDTPRRVTDTSGRTSRRPGRISGMRVAAIRRGGDAIRSRCRTSRRRVGACRPIVSSSERGAVLANQTAVLPNHAALLPNRAAELPKEAAMLANGETVLSAHTARLSELPARPAKAEAL